MIFARNAKMADEPEDLLGKRVSCDGFRGTVRYFGQVPPTSGEWLGVEWDDENRGKHDGTLDGVSYFICSHPKSGSFVRQKKVEFGVPVVDALQSKYSDDVQKHIQDMQVVGKKKITQVEMVGAEKVLSQQSCFQKLKEVSLSNGNVRGHHKDIPLHSIAPNIVELDLSGNLFSSWEDVARTVFNLTNLKVLNISDNRLSMPSNTSSLQASFNSIQELFLNKMNMSWDEISAVISMFPSLDTLHVCKNDIQSLRITSPIASCLKNLFMLDFYGNSLSEWDDLQDLAVLPRLNTLILTNNNISAVKVNSQEKHKNFTSLKSLHLSQNQIKDISSINALNDLPLLEDIQLKENPVFEGWTSFTSRQELIARISSLKSVNRSLVTEKERKSAEQAYIKKYAQEWSSAGGSSDQCDSTKLNGQFLSNHPRYLELIRVHGKPDLGFVNKTSVSLKDSLISLSFKCPDDPSKKIITKKLPGSMTIGKVKGLLYRLYKVDSADQKLSYLDTKNDREIPMDDDLRLLSFYSVTQGDTIFLRW